MNYVTMNTPSFSWENWNQLGRGGYGTVFEVSD